MSIAMADGETKTVTKPDKSVMAELLTRDEMAEHLGVSARTLDRWHRLERGPPRITIGRKCLYRVRAYLDWIEASEDPTPSKC